MKLISILMILLPSAILSDLVSKHNSSEKLQNTLGDQKNGLLLEPQLPPLTHFSQPVNDVRSRRVKRQCGAMGCGAGCRGNGCGSGCRGCGAGGCNGRGCGNNFCNNPCGPGNRLCCDNPAPRPCVGCGLNSGRAFPVALPLTAAAVQGNTCCTCCMPACLPSCVNFGGCACNRFGYDYWDYFG